MSAEIIPEILVGLILMAFAWAFRSWAETIRGSTDKILARLNALALELHAYRLEQEKRMTTVESELRAIEKRLDR